jgi:predicted protein tyrosine phosphatase
MTTAGSAMPLYVTSLSKLHPVAAEIRPARVLSLVRLDPPVETPDGVAPEHHLRLAFNDITTHQDCYVLPGAAHVDALLAFARDWDRAAPMLIHCFAGISRSTAAAFAVACALAPQRDEDEIAQRLRAASPSATPNPRLVALADAALGREGRMIAAIAAIGRGAEAYEGAPFRLDLSAP